MKCTTSFIVIFFTQILWHTNYGCQFFPPGEYLRFVRIPENYPVGQEFLRINVYPRKNLSLRPVDRVEDAKFFTFRELNETTISLYLTRSLEDLVDNDNPRNIIKFSLVCEYNDEEDQIASSLIITVYIEDVNDHPPLFIGDPYSVTIDELAPVGLTVFRGIKATDRDKPHTPNSDIQYAITLGNEKGKFTLGSSHMPFLILKKPLDYDTGDRKFRLIITATDRGNPPLSSNAVVEVTVLDSDDLAPKFTKGIYRTKIPESYPVTGRKIHELIKFNPQIFAFDQDISIDAPIRYDILAGNERHLFYLDHVNGSLFLEKEIDLESEKSLPGNTFVLQIQASQIDNPLRYGVARVEIEIKDLNDNLPEFERDYYNISIVENLPNGFSVMQISATDQDQGDNADFVYQLEDRSKAFSLNPKTGWLTVANQTVLDREKRSSMRLRVLAKEKLINLLTNQIGSTSVIVDVSLLDANDNNPIFIPSNVYEFSVDKDLAIGEVVARVHANDPDLEGNGQVTYSIQQTGNTKVPFRIDKIGRIITTEKLKKQKQYVLIVEAADNPDNPSEKRISVAVVTINVKIPAIDNSSPDFIGAPYEFWVGSNVDIGTSVGQLRVSDSREKSDITFDLLHSYEEGVPFAIEERTGSISVVGKLSDYSRTTYEFEGVVTLDQLNSITTNVTIHVVDAEVEKNILTRSTGSTVAEFHVPENKAGVFIGNVLPNNNTSPSLQFVIANQKDVTDNIVVTPDGSLYTKKPLNREDRDNYHLTVVGEYNKGAISSTGIYQVTVIVDDENDNAPEFEHNHYEGKIKENSLPGTEVDLNYPIKVSDPDLGDNGKFTITIFGDGAERFKIGKNSGKLTYTGLHALDREEKEIYELEILAKDKGGLYSEARLRIKILDENDNPPVFTELAVLPNHGITVLMFDSILQKLTALEEQRGISVTTYFFNTSANKDYNEKVIPVLLVPEDIAVGSMLFKLTAVDKDIGINSDVTYSIISETFIPGDDYVYTSVDVRQYFTIIPTSGEVTVSRNLPPQSEFRLNIAAADIGDLKDNVTVQILVNDVNNHPPVFLQSWYNFDVEEGQYSGKTLGKIAATDADFGKNANISYEIEAEESENFPFTIDKFSGLLKVKGNLDRETKDKYSFVVVAHDNPDKEPKLSSKVNVDVNVLDINDNSPVFHGYDLDVKLRDKRGNEKTLPVYYVYIAEDSKIGTPVAKVFANDSDFSGNGNGLILFSIPYDEAKQNFFAVDSKEGTVTIISKLDYEKQKQHNVTVIASDLGSPSLSSTALVVVNVIDVPENASSIEPLFVHRYYEVEVEENVPVPVHVLTVNVTDTFRQRKLRFSLIDHGDDEIRATFKVETRNGSLLLIKSPDREQRDLYTLGIRVDEYKIGRDMMVMVYPITDDRLRDLKENEVKIVIRITDVNDNPPVFTTNGQPLIAAIPASANYNYPVVRVQATDEDKGINGEIRYQILDRPEEKLKRFAIDSVSGQIRTTANFGSEVGKVFGFDVKATDRRGSDDGKSSMANVFVYVLDDQKQLVMVLNKKTAELEMNMENITRTLFNLTGFDVRVRKLEPHIEKKYVNNGISDLYIYAVDPLLNVVVDMDKLKRVIYEKQQDIEEYLGNNTILALTSAETIQDKTKLQTTLLSRMEIVVVILACLIFLGAFVTAVCLLCPRRHHKRNTANTYFHAPPSSYNMAMSAHSKSSLFPASFEDGMQYTGQEDRPDHFHQVTFPSKFSNACPRYPVKPKPLFRERSKSMAGLETSIASLHSSCHDSGIVDAGIHCTCSQSTTPCSDDSSSNYEDSLNSSPRKRSHMKGHHMSTFSRRHRHKRSRNRSLSEDIMSPTSMTTFHSPICNRTLNPVYLPGHNNSSFRRSTDHLVLNSSMNQ